MALKRTICLVLSCALLGGYASLFTSYHHGFFDELRTCTTDTTSARDRCALDMTHAQGNSFPKTYTHIESIDGLIRLLLEFFAQGLRSDPGTKDVDLKALLTFGYLAAQFGGAWFMIALEGLRLRNTGTVLSWTGSFGIVFQAITITVVAPIYLTLQLLFSTSGSQTSSVLVDPSDLAILPLATAVSYVLPSIGLCLPLLNVLSQEGNDLVIALWQPFPLYQSAVQAVLRSFCTGSSRRVGDRVRINPERCLLALGRAYRFILCLTMGAHLIVVGTIMASNFTHLLPAVSATQILAPTSLTNPPTLALLTPPVSAIGSRAIVVSFLRWDVYYTCASLIIWAAYHLKSTQESRGWVGIIRKALLWTIVGGPIAPAVMLLWERDAIVLDKLQLSDMRFKRR
ncbi:hypothetical protein AK830_g6039 [Neonectria ditissima]|uniref:Uncharacterized protein n=1 Tax=Neonectria ditissima TaxID=78410 RepID=A0A0P7BJG2_9HYPO|nr:hypothetical protein AK830_g6039 [Neonectria ditissima]